MSPSLDSTPPPAPRWWCDTPATSKRNYQRVVVSQGHLNIVAPCTPGMTPASRSVASRNAAPHKPDPARRKHKSVSATHRDRRPLGPFVGMRPHHLIARRPCDQCVAGAFLLRLGRSVRRDAGAPPVAAGGRRNGSAPVR